MFRKISPKLAVLGLIAPASLFTFPAHADRNSDEDGIFFSMDVETPFKRFHRTHKRYPKNWFELRIQSSCAGYYVQELKHFPKPNESITWKPSDCELSYRIDYSNKDSFQISALAEGHVVSIYRDFKAFYFKTPYHDHEPPPYDPNVQD